MSRAGIFGWSYPPGCSGPPDDGPGPPCQVCGEYEEKCKCPECHCGTVGCLKHMSIQQLVTDEQHYSYLANGRTREIARRELEAGPNCEYCGTKCSADLREGSPVYCEKCKGLALKAEREPEPWAGE